jgi:hypothetical protein
MTRGALKSCRDRCRDPRGLIIGFLVFLAVGCFPAAAMAGTSSSRELLFSFDGSDTTAGSFASLTSLDIDQANGIVYVVDEGKSVLDKFNLAGEAQNYSSTGTSSLEAGGGFAFLADVAVDNSAAHPGRIYLMPSLSQVKAFEPSGAEAWELAFGTICGVAVDDEGHLWVDDFENQLEREFESSGSPPSEISSFPVSNSPCRIELDASGSLYASRFFEAGVDKYEGGALAGTFDPGFSRGVAADQSDAAGHIFVLHEGSFAEYDFSGNLIAELGEGEIGSGQAIAYDPSTDRVYVADGASGKVLVFGPAITGPVPDLTIEPVTEIGVESARLNGTVNAQDVNNSWHFEWKTVDQSWAEAESSPSQSVPADSADHHVSFLAEGLVPGKEYEVRLVAFNTDLNLRMTSGVEPFNNITVAAVTLAAAPRLDTMVRINASIDPGPGLTTYHFEYSQDGVTWTVLPDRELSGDSGWTVVSETLHGLTPSTTYRYRVVAENSIGAAIPQGGEKSFTTRSQAEVSDPATCPNQAVRDLQHSNYLGECRAVELVNAPDKGNQNVQTDRPGIGTSPISETGEEAIWSVLGGAPGGSTGTYTTFLAQRTSAGWQSRTLVPPASEQIGAGDFKYGLEAATPNLSKFVFLAGISQNNATRNLNLVRIDREQLQDPLSAYPNVTVGERPAGTGVDLSDDGDHVFFVNPETRQLEDVGGSSPEIISLMPDGTASECGLNEEGPAASFVGLASGNRGAAENWRPGYHRFSVLDGSRVYFETRPNGDCSAQYGLYYRDRGADTTILVDPGVPGRDVQLVRATPDGRSAYFVSYSQLDPADANEHADVYVWDSTDASASCLTCVVPDANLLVNEQINSGQASAVLVSDDFSHIYFQSESQLVGNLGTAGAANLYVLNGEEIRYVATTQNKSDLLGLVNFGQEFTNAQASPDGNVLLLRTNGAANLTDDAVGDCPTETGTEVCRQLYRYDDRDGSLECLSCVRGGETSGVVASHSTAKRPLFNMSKDGNTVAFVTTSPLVERDVNNRIDLYVWRNGVVHLLTDGITKFKDSPLSAPQVRAVSASGRDIFYSIVDAGRTGFERDGLANLYDARIDGGFVPPEPSAHCSEESCQGALLPAPEGVRAGSTAVHGLGNVPKGKKRPRKPCARKRGKARRRCIAHHSHHRKHKAAKRLTGNKVEFDIRGTR